MNRPDLRLSLTAAALLTALAACGGSADSNDSNTAAKSLPGTENASALTPKDVVVLDMAYAPLRLDGDTRSGAPDGADALPEVLAARACRLFSPNKALGLTGVRGAYLVLPDGPALADLPARLARLAPSWPLGTHGQAMLEAWMEPGVQQWLAESRKTLQGWKATLEAGLRQRGWQLMPSVAIRPKPDAGRREACAAHTSAVRFSFASTGCNRYLSAARGAARRRPPRPRPGRGRPSPRRPTPHPVRMILNRPGTPWLGVH